MISFKAFVEAIHRAVSEAASSLNDRNEKLLDTYFHKTHSADGTGTTRQTLTAKTITLEYPSADSEGEVTTSEIQVPLITLVPACTTEIRTATFTAEFGLGVADDQVQIDFLDASLHKSDVAYGRLEVVISPKEPPKGLELLVDGYSNMLKRQLP